MFLLLGCLWAGSHVNAQASFKERLTGFRFFLDRHHYSPAQWDTATATLLSNRFLKELDPYRLLFLEDDITQLRSAKSTLHSDLITGDVMLFHMVQKIYPLRLSAADSLLQVLKKGTSKFSADESFTAPFPSFAANKTDWAMRWQQYLRYQVLESLAEEMYDTSATPETFAKFVKENMDEAWLSVIQEEQSNLARLGKGEQLETELEETFLNAMAWCYDPHTTFMNMNRQREFQSHASASEFSTGLEMELNDKGELAVDFIAPGSSAWHSGQIKKGDVILRFKVNGRDVKVEDMSLSDWEWVMDPGSGEDMIVTIRSLNGETREVRLPRDEVEDEESVVKSFVLTGNKPIGYIHLPGFYSREEGKEVNYDGSANDVSKELVKLKRDKIGGLILDLRDNGGGSIWEAIQLAGIFIDYGNLASIQSKQGKVVFLKDPNRGSIYDGPMIVLLNGASASASEFIGAALQDYNRAIIMGEATYGKGTAQIVLPLDTFPNGEAKPNSDYAKVTTGKFYRVNGNTVQWKGVEPDIVLPGMYGVDVFREKGEPTALKPDMSKAGQIPAAAALPIASLKAKSEVRTAGHPYFEFMRNFHSWAKQYYQSRVISLNPAEYYQNEVVVVNEYLKPIRDNLQEGKMVAVNNSIDKERLARSTERVKERNNNWLNEIATDPVLEEAVQVFNDWIP